MKIINKRAHSDYRIDETLEAGIALLGSEVKAIRLSHADITGSYARIRGSEVYLIGARIFPYKYARPEGYDEKRTRKLLLHKKQIIHLKSKLESGGTVLVPLSLYTHNNVIKIELGLGKGKKEFQKKEALKRRDIARDIERELHR